MGDPVPDVLPIVQGDWVSTPGHHMGIQLGRVKQSWRDTDGRVYMNVVLYLPSGEDVGRLSPPCGGPKRFEPAIEFNDNWQRIERPEFPLRLVDENIPCEDKPGWFTLVCTYYHSKGCGLKPKAVRTKPKKQSSDRPRSRVQVVYVPTDPGNAADNVIASCRRSAQELRDVAKKYGDPGGRLVARAEELEAEADALARPLSS